MDSNEDVSHSLCFLYIFTTVTLLNSAVYIHCTSCVSTDVEGNAFTSISIIFSVTSWQKIGRVGAQLVLHIYFYLFIIIQCENILALFSSTVLIDCGCVSIIFKVNIGQIY